ncbi:MAG TPA: hypothetical protein DHV28_13680 [Ignavibacteriales bacterium]|nr:hypothetical protein [Ignavibacteriales bacterium]
MKQKKNKIFIHSNLKRFDVLIPNQVIISKRLGISQSYVSLILSGKRHSKKYEPRINNLIKKAAEELRAA